MCGKNKQRGRVGEEENGRAIDMALLRNNAKLWRMQGLSPLAKGNHRGIDGTINYYKYWADPKLKI